MNSYLFFESHAGNLEVDGRDHRSMNVGSRSETLERRGIGGGGGRRKIHEILAAALRSRLFLKAGGYYP